MDHESCEQEHHAARSAPTLLTLLPTYTVSLQPASRRGLARRALMHACEFMERNLGRNLRLGNIARAACVSQFHFARLFRLSTGQSPMQYLLTLRIERAKVLLKRGDESVCTIAVAVGFCDQSHFTRVFRRSTGLTPGQFARQCRPFSTIVQSERRPRSDGRKRDPSKRQQG